MRKVSRFLRTSVGVADRTDLDHHDLAELVARNVFHSPILGVSEIAIYLYVTAAYFGFSYTQKEKRTHLCGAAV